MITTAKVFKNGASQAIRLPKEFRFRGGEVCIKRVGSAVLLFPKGKAWDLMGEAIGKFDKDFLSDRNQPARAEERRSL
jgi:antitoxin VapB